MGGGTTSSKVMPIIIPRLEDPADASVDERDEHLMLLEAARHALDVERTECLAAAVGAGDHDVMGYPSMVAYLEHQRRMSGGRANRYVKNARAALQHAATFSAWKHQQISSDEAELRPPSEHRTNTRRRRPSSSNWWATATTRPVGSSTTGGRTSTAPECSSMLRNSCFAAISTRKGNGMVHGEFDLPSLEGETLLTAVDARMPPPSAEDERTTTQRRADALGDLAHDALAASDAPIVGGERPTLNVHVDLAALEGRPGGLHETEDGHVIDPLLRRSARL